MLSSCESFVESRFASRCFTCSNTKHGSSVAKDVGENLVIEYPLKLSTNISVVDFNHFVFNQVETQ